MADRPSKTAGWSEARISVMNGRLSLKKRKKTKKTKKKVKAAAGMRERPLQFYVFLILFFLLTLFLLSHGACRIETVIGINAKKKNSVYSFWFSSLY
jgi:Flp pilus assembly protein TadB